MQFKRLTPKQLYLDLSEVVSNDEVGVVALAKARLVVCYINSAASYKQ